MKYDTQLCRLVLKKEIAPGMFDFIVECPKLASAAKAGQFAHVAVPGKILRRPISICDADDTNIRLVYEVRGEGTENLSKINEGEYVDVLAPLGTGYNVPKDKKVVFVGGGIGVPPLLYAAKQAINPTAILGFRNKEAMILKKDFEEVCEKVIITTDDGSFGMHGFVTQALQEIIDEVDLVCACGPTPMLKAIAEISKAHSKECQVSLEERMGCGVGACLVCACKTKKDGKENYEHVCKKGPVFNAEEVVF